MALDNFVVVWLKHAFRKQPEIPKGPYYEPPLPQHR
jgi:hypothetical protein